MREKILLKTRNEDHREFEALRGMHRHHLHSICTGFRLIVTSFQRGESKERGKRRKLILRNRKKSRRLFINLSVLQESGRRVRDFIKVFSLRGVFLLIGRFDRRTEGRALNHNLHRFDKREVRDFVANIQNKVRESGGLGRAVFRGCHQRDAGCFRRGGKPFKRLRTDTPGRSIHRTEKRRIVIRILHEAQIGQRVFHVSTLEEPVSAVDTVRNAG